MAVSYPPAKAGPFRGMSEGEYRRRIWAWTMYDWANSAFATTVMAAVLPVYFSQVAGATLRSPALATSLWSFGLITSLLIMAVLAPILGTISDISRAKKRFLAIFASIGILATALLVLVGTGDYVLALILVVIGRIGFSGSITFYDSLLPHVARPDDVDRVSSRGYATGYLGGGILLAINIVMLQMFGGILGSQLSFLSVAIWWAVFSIPLFRRIPEPPAATIKLAPGQSVVGASFRRLWDTVRDIQRYKQLFKFLLAFLVYNDGIGTIINIAVIYGAELGFGSVELVLALLLVQFVAIPYSLIFGRLPGGGDRRRPVYLAFVLYNLIALPIVGVVAARTLPASVTGAVPPPYESPLRGVIAGQGTYDENAGQIQYTGDWQWEELGFEGYLASDDPNASYSFPFYGHSVRFTYTLGPESGVWRVLLDGQPALDEGGEPIIIDAYSPTPRYQVTQVVTAEEAGEHELRVENTGQPNPASAGNLMTIGGIDVLPPARESNLLLIIGMILAVEAIGLLLSFLFGPLLFSGVVQLLNTKRSILLALVVYMAIAIWGFFVNSVVEFWFLAWMVAVVQGGSQALSRSLYATLSPAAKSGEFFGLFGIMEKFSGIFLGALLFFLAPLIFGSSRPAVLSLIFLFVIGGWLLTRVDVEAGKAVAREEDEAYLDEGTPASAAI